MTHIGTQYISRNNIFINRRRGTNSPFCVSTGIASNIFASPGVTLDVDYNNYYAPNLLLSSGTDPGYHAALNGTIYDNIFNYKKSRRFFGSSF